MMNREQFKYLKERLRVVYNKKHHATFAKSTPLPKKVAAAARIIKQWDTQQKKESGRRQDLLSNAYAAAHQAIIFREAGDALKALKEFERFTP